MTNASQTTWISSGTGRGNAPSGDRNRRRSRRPGGPATSATAPTGAGSLFSVTAFASGAQSTTARPSGAQSTTAVPSGAQTRTAQPSAAEANGRTGGSRGPRQRAGGRNETAASTSGQAGARSASSQPARRAANPQNGSTLTARPATAGTRGTAQTADFPTATPTTADPSATFAELGVPAPLLPVLADLGATHPFPVQLATLPATLAGRDVLGRGRTGSGKTIAFAVPITVNLFGRRSAAKRPRGLILVPTRELALQVQRTVDPLAKANGLTTVTVFGGVGFGPQTSALQRGVDIVIACPGRLEDLINRGVCDLRDIEIVVLDEADHLADLGFLPGVRRILRATPRDAQRLLFSATLDNGIAALVGEFLVEPVLFSVDEGSTPVGAMSHHVFAISQQDRNRVVQELATGSGRRLLFTRTKHGARKWATALTKGGIPAVDLHGNLSQNARERNLAAFASGAASVLVATDIAARGIHVDGVELVVHVDPPTEHKAYLHRSGRTARAGASGTVVTLMLPDQTAEVSALMRQAGITATVTPVVPGHPTLARIAG